MDMTCIAAVLDKGKVYMGGDSAASNHRFGFTLADAKVFIKDEYIIGSAGSLRAAQILRHSFSPPPPPKKGSLSKFMAIGFVNALRDALKDGGHSTKTNEEEEFNGIFLVGVHGRLFRVESDYNITEPMMNYMAIGSGDMLALGSLATTDKPTVNPKSRVLTALRVAADLGLAIKPPFTVEEL